MQARLLFCMIGSVALCTIYAPSHSAEVKDAQRHIQRRLAINKRVNTELLSQLGSLTQTAAVIRLSEALRDIINNAGNNTTLSQLQSADTTMEQNEDASELLKKLTRAIVTLYKQTLNEKYDEPTNIYGTTLNGIDELIEFCKKKIKTLSLRKSKMERALGIFDKNKLAQYRRQHAEQFKEFEQSISLRNDILGMEKDRIKAAFGPVQKVVLHELATMQNIPENTPLFRIKEFYGSARNLLKFSESNFAQLNFTNASQLLQAIIAPTQEIGKRIVTGQHQGIDQLADQVVDAIRRMINVRKEIVALDGPYRIRTNTNDIDAPWYSYAWSAAKSMVAPTEYTLKEFIAHKGIPLTPKLKAAIDNYYAIIQDPAFEQKADMLEKAQNAVTVIKEIVFPTQQKLAPQLAQKEELVGKLTTIQQQYADLETQLVSQIRKEASEETINALQEKMNALKQKETRLEQEITKNAGLVTLGINTRNLEAMVQRENNYKNKIVSFFEAAQPSESFKNQITEMQSRIHELIQKSNPKWTRETFDKNYQDVLNLLQTIDLYLESIKKINAIQAIITRVGHIDTFRPTVETLNSLLEKQTRFNVSAPTRQLLSQLKEFYLSLANLYDETLQKDKTKPFTEKLISRASTKVENVVSSAEDIRTGIEKIGSGIAAVQDAAATASENIATAKRWYNSIASALAVLKSPNETIKKYVSNAAINMLQFFKNKVQQATTSLVYIP